MAAAELPTARTPEPGAEAALLAAFSAAERSRLEWWRYLARGGRLLTGPGEQTTPGRAWWSDVGQPRWGGLRRLITREMERSP